MHLIAYALGNTKQVSTCLQEQPLLAHSPNRSIATKEHWWPW